MESYEDPNHEHNSARYRSGKRCAGADYHDNCQNEAGTAWSPHWCQSCNAKRIRRITKSLKEMVENPRSEK